MLQFLSDCHSLTDECIQKYAIRENPDFLLCAIQLSLPDFKLTKCYKANRQITSAYLNDIRFSVEDLAKFREQLRWARFDPE